MWFAIESGEHKVLVTVGDCKAFSNTLTYNRAIAIADDDLATRLSLYPNPTSQFLNFCCDGVALARVFDFLGAQLASFSFRNEYALDVSGFVKGISLVEVTAKEGKAVRSVVV